MRAKFSAEPFLPVAVPTERSSFSDEQKASEAFLLPLRGVVYALVHDVNLREDFLQEAAAHFLHLIVASPSQTLSWYVQGCSNHIHNLLRHGSSIDALKRVHLRQSFDVEGQGDFASEVGGRASNEDVAQEVIERDMIEELGLRLNPFDRTVLERLVEGFQHRELARYLGVSHTAVNKSRQRIASVASRIGFRPEMRIRTKRRKSATN